MHGNPEEGGEGEGRGGFIKAKKRYQAAFCFLVHHSPRQRYIFFFLFSNNEHHRYGFPPPHPSHLPPSSPSPRHPAAFSPSPSSGPLLPPSSLVFPPFHSSHSLCSFAASEPSPGLILKAIAISRRRKKGIKGGRRERREEREGRGGEGGRKSHPCHTRSIRPKQLIYLTFLFCRAGNKGTAKD